jgi:hypothetical protein
MATKRALESRLKLAGVLLILGLLTESVCLLWGQPIAFVFLIGLGGLFVFAGIAVYLLAIASSPTERDQGSS